MFKVAAGKTLKSIIISCNVRMAPMRIEQVRELLKYDEMNLDEMGDPGQRTAVFAIMSDTDKTFSFLHAIMMWQSIDILCRRALEKYNGKLPTMVNFIFDEFANIGTIPDIEQTIAVTRSRNIGIDYGQFATSTNYPHTYDVEDSSDVDMDALSGIASDVFDKQPRKKLSRKERKAQAKEMKKLQKESNAKLKANAKSNKSIQKQLKDRDKELSKKNEFARYRRKTAKDVTSFIGYNRMYEDGMANALNAASKSYVYRNEVAR